MKTKIIHSKLLSYINMHCMLYMGNLSFIDKNNNTIIIKRLSTIESNEFTINGKTVNCDEIISFLRTVLPEYSKLGKEIM